jgi:hypothetical protein
LSFDAFRSPELTIQNLLVRRRVIAALAYLFDPDRGRRRRAMTADRIASAVHVLNDAVEVTSRDVRNRFVGCGVAIRSRLRRDRPSDEVLVERIRARIGTIVRHPRALAIDAHEGRVILRGCPS